jgi:predicted lipoprotein with Yx(FWY)xxD motif
MKRLHLFFFSLILTLLLTACGSSYSTTSGSNSGTTSNPTAAPTASNAASGIAAIHTASATVSGKTVTLLTNAQGMTLYYFLPDTATTSACTGGCASTWPPYVSSAAPDKGTLTGTLALQTNANGSQVTYNGHPLYAYSGDTNAGQTNGEGIGNKWFVATNDLTTLKGSSGGNGY